MANRRRDDAVIMIEEEETKWLLHPSAGNESCCIFRVPQCLAKINNKTYQPNIVSIGPYHYGKKHLQMMQQHKGRYLRDLLARTSPISPTLDDYMQAVETCEGDIRGSYSETIDFCSHDLVEMMVLDGIFIIEFFCKLEELSPYDQDDPVLNVKWVFPSLIRDLLRLENQIPFFVLQILFDKSKFSRKYTQSSLAMIALKIINYAVTIPEEGVNQHFKDKPKHLLDLVRLTFIPQPTHPPQDKKHPLVQLIQFAKKPLKRIKAVLKSNKLKENSNEEVEVQIIQSATKLHLSGIKFKPVQVKSFLDIKFHKGVLEIPKISLDDLYVDLILNFVGFEAFYCHCSRYITSYAVFMSCLICTPADATFLCENIIQNQIGTDKKIVDFFRNLGKDVPFDIERSHLRKLFKDVKKYQEKFWHVQWAGFKFTYFDTPWSFLSALAAVILLLLTILQAFYAVYAYYHPQ